MSLRITRFMRSCWVRRRMVFGILASGILLSLLYALSLPTMYTSTTTLMPPDSASSNSNLMSLLSSAGPAASVGSAALGIKSPGAIFVGILGSRTVQESVVTRFDLVHHYKKHLIEDACKRLTADTVIREDLKSGIVTVNVKADNPVLASNIAQEYVAELDRVVNSNSTSAARRERIFLEERLKEIKKDLDDSAEALSRFSTKSRTIDMPSQARAMVDSGLKLQDELATARSDLAGLRQAYSEDNVRVRTASARVEELQRQMDKITGLSQKGGSRVYTSESDYPSLGALPALGLTYADLNRKVLVEEALWEALTKQYEAAKVQEAKEIPTVRVLDVANVPERKSSPVRSFIVVEGTMLSLMVAFIVVFITTVWEEMDARDERKRFVLELAGAMRNTQLRLWSMPGMGWVHTRLGGSK
jgi:capsule polysaccharide export protein KpsE/RkpR